MISGAGGAGRGRAEALPPAEGGPGRAGQGRAGAGGPRGRAGPGGAAAGSQARGAGGGHGAPAPLPVKDRSFHGEPGRGAGVGAGRAGQGGRLAGCWALGSGGETGWVGADFSANGVKPALSACRSPCWVRQGTSLAGRGSPLCEARRGGAARPRRGGEGGGPGRPGLGTFERGRLLLGTDGRPPPVPSRPEPKRLAAEREPSGLASASLAAGTNISYSTSSESRYLRTNSTKTR